MQDLNPHCLEIPEMCLANKDCIGKGGYCTPKGKCTKPTRQYDPCDPLASHSCPISLICDDYSKSCLNATEAKSNASKRVHEEGGACERDWQCRHDCYCDSEFTGTGSSTSSATLASGKCRKRKGALEQCTVPTTSTLALKHKRGDWYDDECLNGFICYPEHPEGNSRMGRCHKRCLEDKDCGRESEECVQFGGLTSIKACAYKKSPGVRKEGDKKDGVKGEGLKWKDLVKDGARSKSSTTPPTKPQQPTPSSGVSKITVRDGILGAIACGLAVMLVILLAMLLYRICKKNEEKQENGSDNAEEFLDDLSKPWWTRRDLLRKHKKHQSHGSKEDVGEAMTAIPIKTPPSNQAIIRTPGAIESTTGYDANVGGKNEYGDTVHSPNKW